MSWDPALSAHVTLTDHGGLLPGVDWCRAACFSLGYGTAERLEQIKILLREVQARFPCVHITILTGEIRALVG